MQVIRTLIQGFSTVAAVVLVLLIFTGVCFV